MGQEASLPQAGNSSSAAEDSEFEHQARAPPSSTNPPPHTSVPSVAGHLTPSSLASTAVAGASSIASSMVSAVPQKLNPRQSSSGKIINAVFQRRGSGAGNAGHASSAAGMDLKISPRSAHTNGDGGIPLMSPEQQQYYMQQQQQQLQLQQQQYMQQQQPNGAQVQYGQNNNIPHQQQLWQQQQYDSPFSGDQHSPTVQNEGSSGRTGMLSRVASVKKAASFRSSGRGAAIINSMKNLSISNPLHRSNNAGSAAKAAGKDVNEWETKWDEDEDDESDEEEEQSSVAPPTVATATAAAYLVGHGVGAPPMHAQARSGMDMGHSSAVPMTQPVASHVDASQPHPSSPIQPPSATQDANLAAVTPDNAKVPQLPDSRSLSRQQSDDGLEWDTGAIQQEIDERPNVQMFMPLLRVLGKGSFGKVVLVQKQKGKERGALFAMKILRKTHLVKRRQIERTRTERKVLSVVNHPFIMKLHYAFQSPDKLYLVLDYCPGGELFFHLSRFRRFPERVTRFYAAELLLAIGHLHKRGIIYRDLKPENVLLDADGHVKLGDFGLAKAGIKHPCEGATSMCGTPEYMAPEVLSQQGHGFCVDYWGLGMLVYEMMTGLPPWYTTDRAKLFRRLKSAPLDIPSYFSPQASNCVSALLERNPRRRLGVTGIRVAMEHEFFRSISWRSLYGRRVEAPIRPCEGWTAPEAVSESESNHQQAGNGTINDRGIENLNVNDLDAATANFDNAFTRMPVETEDKTHDELSDEGEIEELHEDTFVGFTFDDKDRDEIAAVQSARQRASHNNTRNID